MKANRVFKGCGMILLIMLIPCMLLLFISRDYRIGLPGGYEMARPYSEGNCIVDPQGWVVIGKYVDGYQITEALVVGHVSQAHRLQPYRLRPDHQEKLGYFILNTKTGKIQNGLTKSKWASALKVKGISTVPKLKRPNRILAWLSKVVI